MSEKEQSTANLPAEKEEFCPLCNKVKKFVLVKGSYYCVSCGYKLPEEA